MKQYLYNNQDYNYSYRKMKYSTDPQTKYLSPKLFHILLFFFFMSRKYKKQNLYFYDAADSFLLS